MNIIFAVKGMQGFLNGSEVSDLLRNLTVVEFSFYLGYPVLQIAEREYSLAPGEHWGWGGWCFCLSISSFKLFLTRERERDAVVLECSGGS